MTPLNFGECFGWLHPATGGRGVVLCSAFGVEELVTHRFLRQLACDIASAGLPTLRFDYQGTGNSLGTDMDSDRVDAWLSSIRQAVECLRLETGVSEVTLVGFRLGAPLAAEVASQFGDISRLALIGCVASGKAYVREQKVLSALLEQSTGMVMSDTTGSVNDAGGIEVAGFTLTAETTRELERIDMLALSSKPAQNVLVLGRKSPVETRIAGHLRALGCEVEMEVLPGYAEMEWNSTLAKLPDDAFAGLIHWLCRDAPQGTAKCSDASPPATLSTAQWREDPVQFGPQGRLFGIRCGPHAARSNTAVLFVNHGSNHHIGWARMYVSFARSLAAEGIVSLRMDIAGVGDSPAYDGQPENQLYADESQNDVCAALDWLQGQGFERYVIVGHCAGAYLGFYTALRDSRVSGLVLLNLQRFFWRYGDSLEIEMRTSYRATGWYFAMVRDPDIWRRLLRGDINTSGITAALARRLLKRVRREFNKGLGHLSGKEDNSRKVVRWFRELSQRGTKVLLVYTAEDGGLDEIALHGGRGAKKITKLANVDLRILSGADHNLTPRGARQRYFKLLTDYLGLASSAR